MEGIQRVDDTPQHKAVREAFTNAIIHSDLLMDAGILRVEKHDDRLCFRNPGLLRLPVEQIFEGGVSYARNPKIQNMLRMVGYGENLGSGFPLILDAWKQAGWKTPVLNNKLELDMVELVLPIPNRVSNEKVDGNNDVDTDGETQLSERQKDIISLLSVDGNTTATKMAKLLGTSKHTIDRDISFLRANGYIRKETKDNRSPWIVNKYM